MVLSDRTIREEIAKGRIVIQPLGEGCVQPASVDLHLGRNILVFQNNRVPYVDVRKTNDRLTEMVTVGDDDPFMLHPGEFVLGSTLEHVEMPDDLVGACVFLSSAASDFITGQTMVVDGGSAMH